MTDPVYTLQTNGLSVRNDTGTISTEWWSLSPAETETIGNFYQVKATKDREEITTPVKVVGIFGKWVSLSSNQSWSIDSNGTNSGGVNFLIQIRDIFTQTVQASATIQLGILDNSVVGDFYFTFGEPATSPRNAYFSLSEGILNSDIPIAIGDTITFSYLANKPNPGNNENFIESANGLIFFGWAGPGISSFTGYTATLNGTAINSGDSLPYNVAANYPVGGARLVHTIVLTATTATDVHIIGSPGTQQPIFDLTIATALQTWIYPISSLTTTNPDSNGSGNNLVISSNFFLVDNPVMLNTGTNITTAPYFVLDATDFSLSSNNVIYSASSMRNDATGAALDTNSSTRYFGSIISSIPVPYANGFTVEVIVRFNGVVNSNGQACGVISATNNIATTSLWVMGFDNYNGSTVKPQFSLVQRNTIYDRSSNFANNVADFRGDTAISGNIYHLLATIRPSNNSVEFWVNGSSVGSVTLTQVAFDAWAIPNGAGGSQDVLVGNQRTFFDIGPRITNGAWRNGQDSHIQDLKVHLLEADDTFAADQAATANFTT